MRQRKEDTQEYRIFLCRNRISKVYGSVQCYNNAVHDSVDQQLKLSISFTDVF